MSFEKIFVEAPDKHSPIKRKNLRAFDAPHMTKPLRKAIMRRPQPETKNVKTKTEENLNYLRKNVTFAVNCI